MILAKAGLTSRLFFGQKPVQLTLNGIKDLIDTGIEVIQELRYCVDMSIISTNQLVPASR